MTYSCSDFFDDIIRALDIDTNEDGIEAQAELCIAEINRLQQLDEPGRLAEARGGVWGEHHTRTPEDWRLEVENHDTRSGYWQWVLSKLEAEHDEAWQSADDPVAAFFDVSMISFSHHLCNIKQASQT
jgi:hypothetical protein